MGRKIKIKQGNMSIDVDSTAKDIFLDVANTCRFNFFSSFDRDENL